MKIGSFFLPHGVVCRHTYELNVWVAGKPCGPTLTRAVPERIGDEHPRRYFTLLYFTDAET